MGGTVDKTKERTYRNNRNNRNNFSLEIPKVHKDLHPRSFD